MPCAPFFPPIRQEKEALQAQIEVKEKEVEAAQEAAEAAARAVTDRERQLAGQADASADKVRGPACLCLPAWPHGTDAAAAAVGVCRVSARRHCSTVRQKLLTEPSFATRLCRSPSLSGSWRLPGRR